MVTQHPHIAQDSHQYLPVEPREYKNDLQREESWPSGLIQGKHASCKMYLV